MLRALAEVARGARRTAGVTQLDVATRVGVSHVAISRFERGGQPERLVEIIEAYEVECDLAPGTIWRQAVEQAFGPI